MEEEEEEVRRFGKTKRNGRGGRGERKFFPLNTVRESQDKRVRQRGNEVW